MRKAFHPVFILVGIFVILTPWVLLPVCWGKMMRCVYSGRMEIAMGTFLVVIHILGMFFSQKEVGFVLALISITIGVLIVLIPTTMIGVCVNPLHPCHRTLPALKVEGIIVIGLASALLLLSVKNK